MKTETRVALATMLLTVTVDAMAQSGGPRRVMWMIGGGVIGALVGFVAGQWWCRRCHDKKQSVDASHPNDK